jgi:ABC-2 type transport system ATP-binding protein
MWSEGGAGMDVLTGDERLMTLAKRKDSVIAVDALTKRFGDHLAVEDLSFTVPWGKVTGFLGPNGAGKTTTLRMLLGLAAPTSGTATILGRSYAELVDPARNVGVLIDPAVYHPRRSARDHLRVMAAAASLADRRVDEVLEIVELTDTSANKKVGEFSTGMRQRLGLAAALLGEPRVLVLDEPANGLDPSGIRWLRQFLKSFASVGNAVFVSSHVLSEMAETADEVVVINRGRLVVHATVDDLVTKTARVVRVRSPQAQRLEMLLRENDLMPQQESHDELSVRGTTPGRIGELAAEAGVVLHWLDAQVQSLEDIFLELTGHQRQTSPSDHRGEKP